MIGITRRWTTAWVEEAGVGFIVGHPRGLSAPWDAAVSAAVHNQ